MLKSLVDNSKIRTAFIAQVEIQCLAESAH